MDWYKRQVTQICAENLLISSYSLYLCADCLASNADWLPLKKSIPPRNQFNLQCSEQTN